MRPYPSVQGLANICHALAPGERGGRKVALGDGQQVSCCQYSIGLTDPVPTCDDRVMDPRTLKIARAHMYAHSGVGRLARLAAGLTLREVAQAVDVSESTICKWELGQRSPTGEAATRWAELMSDLVARGWGDGET